MLRVALLYGSVCFLAFWALCQFGWLLFPAQSKDDEVMRQLRWTAHMIGEKIISVVLMSVTAFLASRRHRSSWAWGMTTGLASVVAYELIAATVYILQFGFTAYQDYNSVWRTVLWTFLIAGFWSSVAVRDQLAHEKNTN